MHAHEDSMRRDGLCGQADRGALLAPSLPCRMGIRSHLPVLCPVRGKDSITNPVPGGVWPTRPSDPAGWDGAPGVEPLHPVCITQPLNLPLGPFGTPVTWARTSSQGGRQGIHAERLAGRPSVQAPTALCPEKGRRGGERSAVSGPRGWGAGEQGGDSPGTAGRLKSWLWGSNRSACFSEPLSSAETETGPLCGRGPGAGGIPGPRQDPGPRTLPPAV